MAFLVLVGVSRRRRGWLTPVWPSVIWPLTVERARVISWVLRSMTCLLLLGRWVLGALHNKSELTAHYASIGLRNLTVRGPTLTQVVGSVEIVFAVAVLLVPLPGLLLSLCLWKMGPEALFLTAGTLPFEWIERAGSYVAPLALSYLIVTTQCRP